MITLTWKVSVIDKDVISDRAITVHWRLNAEDDSGNTAGIYGASSIQEKAKDIPYNNLNEAATLALLKASMGKNEVERLEKGVQDKLAASLQPTTATGIPW